MTDHHAGHDRSCVCWGKRACGCYLWDQDCPAYEPSTAEMIAHRDAFGRGPGIKVERLHVNDWQHRLAAGNDDEHRVIGEPSYPQPMFVINGVNEPISEERAQELIARLKGVIDTAITNSYTVENDRAVGKEEHFRSEKERLEAEAVQDAIIEVLGGDKSEVE